MNVSIFDYHGGKQYANWTGNEYMGLTFTSEMPGGMISASFDVPCEYHYPHQWAKPWNVVTISHEATVVWKGFIYGLERYWGNESGIRVDCVGNIARLGFLYGNANLSNEKGSTYITDHLAPYIIDYLSCDLITSDYTIPGLREYQPYKSYREIIDDIYSFNQDSYNWYVWGDTLFLKPVESSALYETSTEHCTGALRQDLAEYDNFIFYSYRDAAGVVQATFTYDAPSTEAYPWKGTLESYSDNMTAAQALILAGAALNVHKVYGATAQIDVSRIWHLGGSELHVSEVMPGSVLHIAGLVSAAGSPSEVYIDNDVDTFVIKSVTYNHDSQSINISPGKLPYTLPKSIARKR